jgi:hypothetical protein
MEKGRVPFLKISFAPNPELRCMICLAWCGSEAEAPRHAEVHRRWRKG